MRIEGKNPVKEAIASGVTINKLMVQRDLKDNLSNEIIALAKDKKIRIDFVKKDILDKKSETKRHQGFICETTDYEYCEVDDILSLAKERGENPFIVILDGLEDPHNFGAIIRTCECAGVHGIIIGEHRCVAVTETVLKTSTGAIMNMKIAKVTNINNTIEYLKQNNIWVFGLETGGQDIYKTNLAGAIAIVVGSEGKGISRLTKEKCDEIITLPLKGRINSLNASVATGIAVYEALRQR